MNTINNYNNTNFKAKLGPNAEKLLKSKFSKQKYLKMFDATVGKNIDNNTVLDVASDSCLKISHTELPGVYQTKYNLGSEPLYEILTMCPVNLRQVEADFFRTSVADMKRQNLSPDMIKEYSSKLVAPNSKANYMFYSNLAECISKKHPTSKFTDADFDRAVFECGK